MTMSYIYVDDLLKHQEMPQKGILTRTLINEDHVKAVLFTFAAGEELSEHTASMPAVMHFLNGEATVMLGGDTLKAAGGSWIHMPANLKHSIKTLSPVTMLLLLLKTGKLERPGGGGRTV